jgi:hypothetical protein
MSDYEREIGEMTVKLQRLEMDVSEMRKDLKTISQTLSEAKGSWRTLLAVAGFSSVIGGLLVKFIPFLGGFPR